MKKFTFASFVIFSVIGIAPLQAGDLQTAEEQAWFRNVRQLTNADMGLTKAGEAYFSADGKRICFQGVPKGAEEYQIFVMELRDGATPRMVSTGEGATTCSYFHPDGQRMIFAANHHDQRPPIVPEKIREAAGSAGRSNYVWPFQPGMDIYEYTFATEKLRRLTDAEGYDAEGSFSPDGQKIIFTSMRDGPENQEIYICDADGGNARRITNVAGYDGGPFFSPDGKRIVYRSDRKGNGDMQIFVNNIEGTAERAITPDDALHWCPYWHPSGKWLIYTHARHDGRPNYDLYLLRDDGSEQYRVTFDTGFDGLPVFSNDGTKLMWTSKRGGLDSAQLFIADVVGIRPDGTLAPEIQKTKP